MARTSLFPRTVEEFLDELDRRFPEPRPSPSQDTREIEWAYAQRQVVLTMRDAYNLSRKKASPFVSG